MEKQLFLPIKFYPAREWQEYEKFKTYSKDKAFVKEHWIFVPAFQMLMPDIGRHWGSDDFQAGTFELVDYDDETATDLRSILAKDPIVFNVAGAHRNLVHWRLPLTPRLNEGRYYYHLADQAPGETHWYSEVFEICDMGTNAMGAVFANDTGFASFASVDLLTHELTEVSFCKTGAAIAEAYFELEVFLEEELDLYVRTYDRAGTCGGIDRDWDEPVLLEFRTADGLIVSEPFIIDTTDTAYHFNVKAEVGGTIRLYMHIEAADLTEGRFYLWLQRRYASKHIQLRYSNNTNFCKIIYDQDDYENIFFLDTKQVIDENSVHETDVEDDAANKYRIVGTNQKWNSLQIAGSECMLNAMSLLRLHSNIKIILETGEPIDVAELHIEQSTLDYEASMIKLIYREESCSEDNCGFDVCCPTEGIPMMEDVIYDGPGNLPAAADWNGKYFISEDGAGSDQYRIYISNGAAWSVNTDWDVSGNCLEARQNFDDNDYTPGRDANRFFWYYSAVLRWYHFIELSAVNDNTDGTADVVSDIEYADGLWLQAEYEDASGDWIACSTITLTVALAGAQTHVCSCGVGTFNFRFHIWTDDCDYGYSNWLTQTIT